jgi:hypothetical protein
VAVRHQNYLRDMGWPDSVARHLPVDALGEPLPWYSYAAIHFLEKRLPAGLLIFEFGSGYSTIWWAGRSREVQACEHDREWCEKVSALLPANASLRYVKLDRDGEYSRAATATGLRFDVVVVDGRDRVHCAIRAMDSLAPDGVMIWDDSERERYEPGFTALSRAGFRRVDFIGLGPVTRNRQCTSIFYRSENRLGL